MIKYMPAFSQDTARIPLTPWEQDHRILTRAAVIGVIGAPFAAAGVAVAGSSEAVAAGAGAVIAAGRAAGEAAKPRLIALALHWVFHQFTGVAERLDIEGAEQAVRQEEAGAIQSQMEHEGEEEGSQLVGKAGQSAGQKTLQSMAAATAAAKGYDSVRVNSNGSVTGKSTPIGSRIAVSTTCSVTGCTTN